MNFREAWAWIQAILNRHLSKMLLRDEGEIGIIISIPLDVCYPFDLIHNRKEITFQRIVPYHYEG